MSLVSAKPHGIGVKILPQKKITRADNQTLKSGELMVKKAKSTVFSVSYCFFFLFLLAGFVLPNLEAEGVKPADADKSARASGAAQYPAARLASAGLPLTERESVFSPLPSAAWAAPYQTMANQKLMDVLWTATEKAGFFARNVTQSLGDYVKERQIEAKQQELIRRFYEELDSAVRPMRLAQPDYEELVRRVEQVYIEDGETGAFRLDTTTFRDLPMIVKAQHAEMVVKKVSDGTVETFYPSGALKTRWTLAGGKLNGPATTYYEDGEILTIDNYRDGLKIHRRKFNAEGRLEFEQAYDYDLPAQAVSDSGDGKPVDEEPRAAPSQSSASAEVIPVV